jgi:hypothetical protein
LSVRARLPGATAERVEQARVERRSVVRTWCVRGTLHLVAAEDLTWLLPALAPVFVRGNARRRAQLGLDDDRYARALVHLRRALSDGPLTRAHIRERLREADTPIEGQAAPHLLGRAALEGVVCLGPDEDGHPTYVLLDDWLGRLKLLPRDAAVAQLVARYVKAYGPAVTPNDCAAWSGLPMADIRAAWKSPAPEQIVSTGRHTQASGAHAVKLLPAFDTYLLGYASREAVLPPAYARRIHPGGGVIRPSVLLDGRVVGTWSLSRPKRAIQVVEFETLPSDARPSLEAELADVRRFLRWEPSCRA